MTVRRRFIIPFIAAVLLISAVPALAQVRRIQGKVVDGEGQPVAGAAIEATIVSLADADFAVRNNDQTWRARTNETGDYIVTVPAAGTYVVTATKEGTGSDRTRVAAAERPRHREPDAVEAGGCHGNRAELRSGRVHRRVRAQWTGGRRRPGAGAITRLGRGRTPAYTRLQ